MSASEQADISSSSNIAGEHGTYTTEQEEGAQAIITASQLTFYDVRPIAWFNRYFCFNPWAIIMNILGDSLW